MEKMIQDESSSSLSKKLPSKKIIESYLTPLGITINGNNPWDITVHDDALYGRVFREGALGLGEAYMDHWWDCERLDILFDKILRAHLDIYFMPFNYKLKRWLANIINLQTKHRAKEVAEKHYDIGNKVFKAMLDSRMIYSCGYWKDVTTLEDAQVAKLNLICKKLQLQPGMRLLDIGCGWGGLAKFAAENYDVQVVGVTISKEQYEYAQTSCKGLPIEIRLEDYRDMHDQFDRIVSVGMFEHVGHLNYTTFMKTVHNALKPDGLFLLHTIGSNNASSLANEWIVKYIFPNGMLPSIPLIGEAADTYFVMEDWQNFGAYYDTTLMSWHDNFVKKWPELQSDYDDRFYRMWTYYLLSCAGSFRARDNQLWQIVFSKSGLKGVYNAPR